jgi:hypothetical protein
MSASFIVAVCMVLALYIMIPKSVWRYLAGYVFIWDLLASAYVINMGIATGTVTGLAAGFIAALFITIILRVMRYTAGSVRLALEGDTTFRVIVAGLFTQAIAWIRAIVMALFKGGRIEAPKPLSWTWVEHDAPHSLKDAFDAFLGFLRPAVA